MSSVLLFAANDGGTGFETWLTNADGTSATLIDLFPGPNGSVGSLLSRTVGGELFFEADNGQSGVELYKSDGTVEGTVLFADIEFGPGSSTPFSSFPEQTITIGDTLYFSPFTTDTGQELWKTTNGGTPELVRDLFPGASSSFADWMVDLNGTLIFSASDGASGTELYRSDGTEAGTQRIADIFAGAGSSGPVMLKENILNNAVYFSATEGTNGRELWKSDGTEAGTTLVRDINPGATGSAISTSMAELNGTLYFSANDGTNGQELWRTDGTNGGTNLVTNINPGAGGATIGKLAVLDDEMLFFANNGSVGRELWKSDGSSSGTTLVRDIRPGAGSSFSNPTNTEGDHFTLFDGKAWFIANDGSNGTELWVTDGTAGGTRLFKDINPGSGSANISDLAVADGLMYFSANNGSQGQELWVTDGTDAGTRLVQDVRVGSTGSGAVAIGVIDINVAPEAPELSNNSVAENAPGTIVGALSATDADGDTLAFSLTDDAQGRFSIVNSQLVATGLDFEAAASHSVTVQAADPSGLTSSQTFTINVTNVAEAPGAVSLSGSLFVQENAAAGAVAGTVSATDPDGDVLTFSLTDSSNGQFTLNGTTLQTTGPLDFEAGATRSVTVQARDPGGLTSSQTFSIAVGDVNEAPQTGVTLTGDAGANTLNGTELADNISGGEGNDTLNGFGGNDTLQGDNGTDNLVGGDGDDLLIGGTSEDDRRDNMFGGEGNDTIRGGYGNDEVRGDAGNDVVSGGFGGDTVIGGTGNDSITGSALGDLLFGSDGDDFINGGFGFDRVNGGNGADEFFHLGVRDHGTDFIQDYSAAEGDVLVSGISGATADQFQINYANRERSGEPNVEEAFVIYKPTEQIMWALIDGRGTVEPASPTQIRIQIGGDVFDLVS